MNPDYEFESEERKLREVKPAEPGEKLRRRLEDTVSSSDLDAEERKLREVKPAAMSERLRRRLESAVSYPPLASVSEAETVVNVVRPPRSFWARPWFQTAAAAIVGAAAVFLFYDPGAGGKVAGNPGKGGGGGTPPVRTATGGIQLAGHENRVFDARDEGIVVRDEKPYRKLRYNTFDRRVFRNPETGAVYEVLIPREDVLIVPAETF